MCLWYFELDMPYILPMICWSDSLIACNLRNQSNTYVQEIWWGNIRRIAIQCRYSIGVR